MTDITQILSAIEQGDPQAAERLLPLVYDELRTLAAARMTREKPGQTLQATALVHEAYMRLVGGENAQHWDNHGHFFAAAAEAMRRILVENARRKESVKRGGDMCQVELQADDVLGPTRATRLIALDDALRRLEEKDPPKAQLVKLRYFAGMTNRQAAEMMGIGITTANRYWTYARAWLATEISDKASE
jgi:RNA polymerase sigma factor (TIGR02999 family)